MIHYNISKCIRNNLEYNHMNQNIIESILFLSILLHLKIYKILDFVCEKLRKSWLKNALPFLLEVENISSKKKIWLKSLEGKLKDYPLYHLMIKNLSNVIVIPKSKSNLNH